MRQLFITIALAAIMAILAAVGCAAQDNVASAYNKFSQCVDGEFTTMSKVINYRDIDSGEIIGECEVKQFKLPAGKGNYIKNLTRAMAHDSDNAYHSASGKAGNKGVTYAIAYGTGKNDFELIGADDDMDFMVVCFKDKLHSDNRISYAVEWRQDEDNCYTGKIYKIYGKKPDEYQSRRTMIFKGIGKNGFTLSADSLMDLSSLKKLKSVSPQLEMLGEQLGNGMASKVLTQVNDEINNNTTWLTTFAMYCNKFKDKVKQSPTKGATYATEILEMCKQANGVITDSEKKLCVKSLKECQRCSDDTFVTGLLDEAINWLSGKYKN